MTLLIILLFATCFIGTAFFAGIETGVISCHRIRLRALAEKGVQHLAILEFFLTNPDRLLGTTLIGTNICTVTLSVLAARFCSDLLGTWGEAVSDVVMTILILVFCEYIPKAWFQSDPIERSRPFATTLWLTALILRPFAYLITKITNLFLPSALDQPSTSRPLISRDEIDLLAKESADRGILSPRQRIMIHRVVELTGKMAAQVMIPRDRIVVVQHSSPIRDFLDLTQQSHFTRLPVWDESTRKFVGIANLFDVLALDPTLHDRPIADFMRPPQFINASTPLTEIFPRMRSSRQPMGLVINPQAEVVGVLTTEDILNHIVGTA
jgi:CBS domain containing-hemolysin-like protein